MFSPSFILASLLLARPTVSSPVPRDACAPTVIGSGITIASGDWEIGYASSVAGALSSPRRSRPRLPSSSLRTRRFPTAASS
ncbi:hypothetical protein B0H11DRAFT_2044008 [Mycena galericulata]|nr:hypothetical protein B0H11DRAFT_2044008 [Mycena galericulata]